MPIQIISKRTGGYKGVNIDEIISISRPSVLGNPFTVQRYGHSACIQMFDDYFDNAMNDVEGFREAFMDIVSKDKSGVRLGLECWCTVADGSVECHGHIIERKVEEYISLMAIGDHEQIEDYEADIAAQSESLAEIPSRDGIPWGDGIAKKSNL